jgi:hypothetical protein
MNPQDNLSQDKRDRGPVIGAVVLIDRVVGTLAAKSLVRFVTEDSGIAPKPSTPPVRRNTSPSEVKPSRGEVFVDVWSLERRKAPAGAAIAPCR